MTYGPYNTRKQSEQEKLIREHLATLEIVVDRMTAHVPSFMDRNDMMSAAMIGLIDAAKRFDPTRGINFKTFAEHRIRGAIYDEVRKQDWFSRSLRDKHSRLSGTVAELEKTLGRYPEEEEVAAAMELSIGDYRDLLGQVCHLGCISLNETLDKSDTGRTFLERLEDESMLGPNERFEAAELTRQVADIIKQLTEKERLVISLFYYEELSQKEIAEVLDLSEGRISQLHSQALVKLRTKMGRL